MKRVVLALTAVLLTSSSSGAGDLYRDLYNRNTGSYRSAPEAKRDTYVAPKSDQTPFRSSPAIGTKGMYGYGDYQSLGRNSGHFGSFSSGSSKPSTGSRNCLGHFC